jgi:hypothetical protein
VCCLWKGSLVPRSLAGRRVGELELGATGSVSGHVLRLANGKTTPGAGYAQL